MLGEVIVSDAVSLRYKGKISKKNFSVSDNKIDLLSFIGGLTKL